MGKFDYVKPTEIIDTKMTDRFFSITWVKGSMPKITDNDGYEIDPSEMDEEDFIRWLTEIIAWYRMQRFKKRKEKSKK